MHDNPRTQMADRLTVKLGRLPGQCVLIFSLVLLSNLAVDAFQLLAYMVLQGAVFTQVALDFQHGNGVLQAFHIALVSLQYR